MKVSPFFRKIHKWIGLLLGLQFVIWTISGAAMALLDMEAVAGGPQREAPAVAVAGSSSAWPRVQRALSKDTISTLVVRPMLGRHVLEIGTSRGTRLFDAVTGLAFSVDARVAARVAQQAYAGTGTIKSVTLVKEPSLAIREHATPAWRVDFRDEENSSFYVSQSSGELLERRNDTWRIWDFFWMLHNMDYVNRTSFNHPLIIFAGVGAMWLAVTGSYLMFRTTWRPELRMINDFRSVKRIALTQER